MKRKQDNFRAKYGNQEIGNVGKQLEELEEVSKAKIHIDLLKATLKKKDLKTQGRYDLHGFRF